MLARVAAVCAAFLMAETGFAAGALSGRRAPGFSLPDRTGKQYDPQDFRGQVVLLEVLQTTCAKCKVVSGILEQLQAKYAGRVQVMSIVVLPDTIDKVNAYIKENGISAPVLFDCGQATASYLKITPQNPTVKFPHVFVIDKEGIIRNDFAQEDVLKGGVTAAVLSAEIDKLLAGTAPKKR
jgi:peroxiredoxin